MSLLKHKSLKRPPDASWPVEAVLFCYPGKRAYGEEELILTELKLNKKTELLNIQILFTRVFFEEMCYASLYVDSSASACTARGGCIRTPSKCHETWKRPISALSL